VRQVARERERERERGGLVLSMEVGAEGAGGLSGKRVPGGDDVVVVVVPLEEDVRESAE
jgi:hypothetical protein